MKRKLLLLVSICSIHFSMLAQSLADFKAIPLEEPGNQAIIDHISFNGYTNHWNNYYTEWHRYGNLFKIATPEVKSTILQSKVDIAEDMGIPGLLMQEGFISELFRDVYATLENPLPQELEKALKNSNVLVLTDPSTSLGKDLEANAASVFQWADRMKSHQFNEKGLVKVRAFYLVNGDKSLLVVSSSSKEKINQFLSVCENTRRLLNTHDLRKGWLGIYTTLKAVTCTPGHPLEIIGKGLNEGVSWFIFDGYMSRFGKKDLETWVQDANLPIVAGVGNSPIYGCESYAGLQVQDMTKQSWIDFAHSRKGYAFRPVYDPESDAYQYDGWFAEAGNKEQIDNENTPFILRTGGLSGNLTSSMVLFIEKTKGLSEESIWDAIMNRKAVAVLERANMMGSAMFRNALQLLYLDKIFLEEYFGDNLDLHAQVEGYQLTVSISNHYAEPITGNLQISASPAINPGALPETFSLQSGETKQFAFPLQPGKDAMGKANPVYVEFLCGNKKKSTIAMLDLPPTISMHQLFYAQAPEVEFPLTIHNFGRESSFPVEIEVFDKKNPAKRVYRQSIKCEIPTSEYKETIARLKLNPGTYLVRASALGATAETQLGVGKAGGKPYVYEIDLNSDGVNEFRMENDSVQITLLRTGARVIEYIVKSKDDNVLFKIWPEKTYNHRRPFRMRGFYPYGGFEDFLGQASMETHRVYDAKIVKSRGSYVQVEMETDYYGNRLKKIFTLYGNSPLLEVRFALNFINPEANVIGPQPILELGRKHGTEDLFTVPAMEGMREYRMRMEDYYGQAIDLREGWNAGYDTIEDISFVGAFPVAQPIFLHMWMNHPKNAEAPHYYVEFQPWTPIIQKSTMYFSYYLWGSGGPWQNGVDELRKRNLITIRN